MSNYKNENSIQIIEKFLSKNKKDLNFIINKEVENIKIIQESDKKSISFDFSNIKQTLERKDSDNKSFLQINFKNGKKILLTKEFIGFAPAVCENLDIEKLPKVVTTSDLLSVIEAIESSLYGTEPYEENLSEVNLFFESIACGAESIGFNLTGERLWISKLISNYPTLAKKHIV